MPYPARLLNEGEEIVHESKQSWIALRDEIGYTAAWLALWLILVPWLDFPADEWIAWIVTLAWGALVGGGIALWYNTDLVVTSKRVIYQTSVFDKSEREIELSRLVEVGYRQSVPQRLVSAGDLLLDTGGHDGKTRVRDVDSPLHVSNVIEQARHVEEPPPRSSRLPGEPPPASAPVPERQAADPRRGPSATATNGPHLTRAEQLDILARLHNDGKLTDQEFMAEKRRVLESE